MAIQLRRGVYTNFDPTKLLPGEVAVVQENDPDGIGGTAVYVCFSASNVKRFLLADDAVTTGTWIAEDINENGNVVISVEE